MVLCAWSACLIKSDAVAKLRGANLRALRKSIWKMSWSFHNIYENWRKTTRFTFLFLLCWKQSNNKFWSSSSITFLQAVKNLNCRSLKKKAVQRLRTLLWLLKYSNWILFRILFVLTWIGPRPVEEINTNNCWSCSIWFDQSLKCKL